MDRLPGEIVTFTTRSESNESVDRRKRYREIITILKEMDKPMTAKEIAVEMYKRGLIPTSERNFSAPRLTELMKYGMVECNGKKRCQYTGKSVGLFVLRRERNV